MREIIRRAAEPLVAEQPDGSVLDVVMLQAHVISASMWLILAVLAAVVAVPRFRRVPSAAGLHALQAKRGVLLSALCGGYVLTLSTGVFLLFQHAAYDPPLSASEWSSLDEKPYALPYYYALYGKILIFVLMGVATSVLAAGGSRAAKQSESAGGPADPDLYDDESLGGVGIGRYGTPERGSAALARAMLNKALPRQEKLVGPVRLWTAVSTIVVGMIGVVFCVTLIKYFHELSKAAVVYEILKTR